MAGERKLFYIDTFNGGLSDSSLIDEKGTFAFSQDCDILDDPQVLKPQKAMISDNSGTVGTGSKIRGYIKASDGKIYALGDDGTGNNRLFYKTTITGNWATAATATASSSPKGGIWEYQDYLYFFNSATVISRYGPLSGTPALTETWDTVTGATLAGAFVHSDGNIYFFERYRVYWYDNATLSSAITPLDLPTNYTIVDIDALGNNLGIVANDTQSGETSKLFIWSPYTAETGLYTYDDVYDLRDYNAQGIINVARKIYILFAHKDYKILDLNTGKKKILDVGSATTFSIDNEAIDSYEETLYFGTTCSVSGFYNGIYGYGSRDRSKYSLALFLSWALNTGSAVDTSNITIHAIKWIELSGEANLFVSWDDGTNYYSNRIGTNYSSNADWESQNFSPFKTEKSQIKRISIHHKKLPSGCSVVLKHKADFATNWTTIGTSNTANATKKDFYSDSSQKPLPEGVFHQLRLELNSSTTTYPEITHISMEAEAKGL